MSIPVSLDALREQLDVFGDHPYLVTVGADRAAHVVSVTARLEVDRFALGAGRTSSANVASNPTVTLLWPAAPGGDYSLIVDGQGEPAGSEQLLTIVPTRAVLHRVAGASPDVASCVRLEADT